MGMFRVIILSAEKNLQPQNKFSARKLKVSFTLRFREVKTLCIINYLRPPY